MQIDTGPSSSIANKWTNSLLLLLLLPVQKAFFKCQSLLPSAQFPLSSFLFFAAVQVDGANQTFCYFSSFLLFINYSRPTDRPTRQENIDSFSIIISSKTGRRRCRRRRNPKRSQGTNTAIRAGEQRFTTFRYLFKNENNKQQATTTTTKKNWKLKTSTHTHRHKERRGEENFLSPNSNSNWNDEEEIKKKRKKHFGMCSRIFLRWNINRMMDYAIYIQPLDLQVHKRLLLCCCNCCRKQIGNF